MNYRHGHAKHVDGAQSQAYRVWAAYERLEQREAR